MSEAVAGRLAIKARQVRPGTAQAIAVTAGQVVQIVDMKGKQVTRMVAFVKGSSDEYLSVAASRTANNNLMIQQGQQLISNRGTAVLEIIADAVGRHDTLIVADPRHPAAVDPAASDESLGTVLATAGIRFSALPDPISWFQNVSIQQRGELIIREPLSEAGDDVLLSALVDLLVGIEVPAAEGGDILVRVYKEAADATADKAADAVAATATTDEAAPEGAAGAMESAEPPVASDETPVRNTDGDSPGALDSETVAVIEDVVVADEGTPAGGTVTVGAADEQVEGLEELPIEAAAAFAPATFAEAPDPVPAGDEQDDVKPKPAAG